MPRVILNAITTAITIITASFSFSFSFIPDSLLSNRPFVLVLSSEKVAWSEMRGMHVGVVLPFRIG